MALDYYEATAVCQLCGRPTSVCQAPENEDRFDVEAPTRCHATTALIRAQERGEYEQERALLWATDLRT